MGVAKQSQRRLNRTLPLNRGSLAETCLHPACLHASLVATWSASQTPENKNSVPRHASLPCMAYPFDIPGEEWPESFMEKLERSDIGEGASEEPHQEENQHGVDGKLQQAIADQVARLDPKDADQRKHPEGIDQVR